MGKHFSTPDICHFWYTTIFSRPVKSTPKKCVYRDKNFLATKQRKFSVGVLDILVGVLGILVAVLVILIGELDILVGIHGVWLAYFIFWLAYLMSLTLGCCIFYIFLSGMVYE